MMQTTTAAAQRLDGFAEAVVADGPPASWDDGAIDPVAETGGWSRGSALVVAEDGPTPLMADHLRCAGFAVDRACPDEAATCLDLRRYALMVVETERAQGTRWSGWVRESDPTLPCLIVSRPAPDALRVEAIAPDLHLFAAPSSSDQIMILAEAIARILPEESR